MRSERGAELNEHSEATRSVAGEERARGGASAESSNGYSEAIPSHDIPPRGRRGPGVTGPLGQVPGSYGRPRAGDRLRSRNLHNLPVLLVLSCAAGGLAYSAIMPTHWLRGVLFMAGALIMGGLFRMVLPARQAGLLAVRGRTVDVLCYVGTGV